MTCGLHQGFSLSFFQGLFYNDIPFISSATVNEISYSEFINGNPPTVNVMGIQLKPPLTKLLTLM